MDAVATAVRPAERRPLVPLEKSVFDAAARINAIERFVVERFQANGTPDIITDQLRSKGMRGVTANSILNSVCEQLGVEAIEHDEMVRVAAGKLSRYDRMVAEGIDPKADTVEVDEAQADASGEGAENGGEKKIDARPVVPLPDPEVVADAQLLSKLLPRSLDVLAACAEGLDNAAITVKCGFVSEPAAQQVLSKVYQALGLRDLGRLEKRPAAIAIYERVKAAGLLPDPSAPPKIVDEDAGDAEVTPAMPEPSEPAPQSSPQASGGRTTAVVFPQPVREILFAASQDGEKDSDFVLHGFMFHDEPDGSKSVSYIYVKL